MFSEFWSCMSDPDRKHIALRADDERPSRSPPWLFRAGGTTLAHANATTTAALQQKNRGIPLVLQVIWWVGCLPRKFRRRFNIMLDRCERSLCVSTRLIDRGRILFTL
jgi:hypothetical protein